MNLDEFEETVEKVLESVPEEFRQKVENLSIVIDESNIPSAARGGRDSEDKITLALYHGVPITKRAGAKPVFPDKITIYKRAIESVSKTPQEIKKNIRRVVLHELGHYFGLSEKKLRELEY
ncbi:MAG: metallopeptidase family protein [Actinobacteria bacterium]|nr:metallopeptidase family protein [Actinomycetota bacterium]